MDTIRPFEVDYIRERLRRRRSLRQLYRLWILLFLTGVLCGILGDPWREWAFPLAMISMLPLVIAYLMFAKETCPRCHSTAWGVYHSWSLVRGGNDPFHSRCDKCGLEVDGSNIEDPF